jgi:hypothetical protein
VGKGCGHCKWRKESPRSFNAMSSTMSDRCTINTM